VAGGEDEPLQLAAWEEHPGCCGKDDPLRVDAVAEGSPRGLDGDRVAEMDLVELQKWVGVRDAMAGDGDGAWLAGHTRSHVVAWALREHALCRSLVESQSLLEPRDRQDAEASSRRGMRGGSPMQRCKGSGDRES
jgi:hypothetical protein